MTEATPEPAALGALCRAKFFSCVEGVDAVVTTDPVHIGYLSGYRSILQDMPPYKQALVATRDRLAIVTGASDAAAALEVLGCPDAIWRYGVFYVERQGQLPGYPDLPPASIDFHSALRAALADFGLDGLSIGLDVDDAPTQELLKDVLAGSHIHEAAPHFRRSRMTKLGGELEMMRKASCITDEAIARIHPLIRPGVTEQEIAGEITGFMVRRGGVPRFVVVTSGERSSRVDAYASGKPLVEGDLVRIDVGCTVGGYYSDMARTFVVGAPAAEQEKRYEALLKGELAQIDLLKPGVLASEIYEVAMRHVRQGALPHYQRNHCGHSIGLRAHEFPSLAAGQEVPLEPGMVFCVETPYYEIGWGGMMVEDTAIITPTGHELLTVSSRQLVPLTPQVA